VTIPIKGDELKDDEITALLAGDHSIIAMLTIDRCAELPTRTRIEMAEWLRRQAHSLELSGHNYDDNFCARYLLPKKRGEKS